MPPIWSHHEEATSGEDEWVSVDVSNLGDPEAFMRFLEASNFFLGYSDSDDGDYDPSRECFNLKVDRVAPDAQGNAGPSEPWNMTPPPNMTPEGHPGAHGAASAPVEARRPDLKQLDKLEARLEEKRVRLRQLRETLEQDQPARGDRGATRCHARDVNWRIVEDYGVITPPPQFSARLART